MVCIGNEVKVEVVSQDGTDKTSITILLSPTTSTEELYIQVSAQHNCEPDSFELILPTNKVKTPGEVIRRSSVLNLIGMNPSCLNKTTTILMKPTDQPQINISLPPLPIITSDNLDESHLIRRTRNQNCSNRKQMTCVEDEIQIEILDEANKKSYFFTLPTLSIEELRKQVSAQLNLELNSFDLVGQVPDKKPVEVNRSRELPLLNEDPSCLQNSSTILMKSTDSNRVVKYNLVHLTGPRDKEVVLHFCDSRRNRTVELMSNHPEKNYVGLVNQAMTCYLNSLLQALYMTPEFRNALYNWEYIDRKDKEEALSIPYQLQKLFLNLQTSTKTAVETTSLTKSFGWDSTEAWQQHDIQELCRVMFEALETKFKGTEQADLIKQLYEGKMIDYVKCLECKTEKSREDTFLDIPLPVRSFQSSITYGSVEDALRAFVKYETLDGTNQYHCDKCNKKCNAHKGLKFTKFPYLLTLHLKRFDFDYNTLYRIKLNNKVAFPYELNLNSFINTTPYQESSNGEEDVGLSIKCDDSSTTDSGTVEDEFLPCDGAMSTNNHSSNHDQEDDEGIDMSNGVPTSNGNGHNYENGKNVEKCLVDEGPYMYDLFSIMIHSGSASGGHYYAYIKDYTTKQWLCFNDTTVNLISHSDIQKVFGGGPNRVNSSSTNAYMLMYRQIDETKNAMPMQEENFPQHIQALLKKMKETDYDGPRYHSRYSPSYKIKIFCHHPKTKRLMTNKLNMLGESTWAEQTEKAYEKFGLHGDVQLDQCRLVFYDHLNDLITHSYEGSNEDTICDVFEGNKRNDLLLEIRKKDEPFETYKPEGITTNVYVIDVPQADITDGPISVRGYQAQTVREYKQQLAKIVNIKPEEMNLVERTISQYQLLQDDITFKEIASDSYGTHKIYVSSNLDTDITEPYKNSTNELPNSKLFSVIESLEKVIWLHVQLPEINKEVLEDLNIPSLENESKDESPKFSSNGQKELNENDSQEVCLDELSNQFPKKVIRDGKKVAFTKNSQSTTLNLDDSKDESPKVPSNGQMELNVNDSQEVVKKTKKVFRRNSDKFRKQKYDERSKLNMCSRQHVETTTVKWKAGLESTSEDSSLSDSEKTLVDDSSGSYNTSNKYCEFIIYDSDEESDHYFKGIPCPPEENHKLLKVLVDKRMRFETLKKKLEKFTGVSVDYFNVYSQPVDGSETECTDLKRNLKHFNDGARFCVKLGRALRKGELKIKLYKLQLDCPEQPFKFMFDWIVGMDMTVAQGKEEILAELKRKHGIEIPFQRLRLRKKINKLASVVLLNNNKFEDLRISSQDEVIIQELPENETVTETKQLVLFVRKWIRSTLQFGDIQEVVLDSKTFSELKEKIALLSGIPEEYLEITSGKGSFPCVCMSLLEVEEALQWRADCNGLVDKWPLDLHDGSVVLYRDTTEIVKQLSPEEKREFINKENSRLLSLGTTPSYSSPRREKSLKIYLDSK